MLTKMAAFENLKFQSDWLTAMQVLAVRRTKFINQKIVTSIKICNSQH